jgi:phospholipase C
MLRKTTVWPAIGIIMLLLIGVLIGDRTGKPRLASPHKASATGKLRWPAGLRKIRHIVIIVKENRTFDNYFGTFPGADGTTTGVISTGETVQLGRTPDRTPHDIGHSFQSAVKAINSGLMNQFDLIPGGNVGDELLAYTQLTEDDIPNYFAINNPRNSGQKRGCDADDGADVQVMDENGVITREYPCFDFMTLADSLEARRHSWRYYAPPQGQPSYIWSALDAIAHSRLTDLWTQHVVPDTQFEQDARNGDLPAVSWLVTGAASEHPPAVASARTGRFASSTRLCRDRRGSPPPSS